jgi:hypothetical protein
MDRQGFDPYDANHTASDLVAFLEQIESSEEFDVNSEPVPRKNKGSSSSNKKSGSYIKPSDERKPTHHCDKHGANFSHDTKDCNILNGNKRHKGNDSKNKFGNKTWQRKSDDSINVSKKELQAMIATSIKQVKKDLNAAAKKRKSDDDDNVMDMNAMDLAEFNYTEMDNLKIDSEDEASC